MPYSAVTQPLPVLRRNGGTFSSTLAVQSTWVSPKRARQEPSAYLATPGSSTMRRISSGARPEGRGMGSDLLLLGRRDPSAAAHRRKEAGGSFEPPHLVLGPLAPPAGGDLVEPAEPEPPRQIPALARRQALDRRRRHRRHCRGASLERQPVELGGAHLREKLDGDPGSVPLPAELGDEGGIGFAGGHDGSFRGSPQAHQWPADLGEGADGRVTSWTAK